MSDQVAVKFGSPSKSPSDVIHVYSNSAVSGQDTKHGAQHEALLPGEVKVVSLYTPINPQDIMVIAGLYPVKPQYTEAGESVAGYDGVWRVEAVGQPAEGQDTANSMPRPGDLVIPRRHGLGTWRRHSVLPADALLRIPWSSDNVEPVAAGLMRTVLIPAYLLIEDMRSVRPGDWVVQNAGGSAIAQMVAQFARRKGANVLSIVRDHHGDGCIASDTTDSTIHVVVTEKHIATHGADVHAAVKHASSHGRLILGLDAVFGQSGQRLAHLLSRGGTLVNYGSLGGADGVISLTQQLIFWNEIQFRNFRLSNQLALRSVAEQEHLLAWFASLFAKGRLHAPSTERIVVPRGDNSEDLAQFSDKVKGVLGGMAKRDAEPALPFKKYVFDWTSARSQ